MVLSVHNPMTKSNQGLIFLCLVSRPGSRYFSIPCVLYLNELNFLYQKSYKNKVKSSKAIGFKNSKDLLLFLKQGLLPESCPKVRRFKITFLRIDFTENLMKNSTRSNPSNMTIKIGVLKSAFRQCNYSAFGNGILN